MRGDAIAMGTAGVLFGLLAGWMIGSQTGSGPAAPPRAAAETAAPASQNSAAPAPRAVDPNQVQELTRQSSARPSDPAPRIELGNLLFDAERFTEAIRWYEEAHRLDPGNVSVSTDLGVSYYYANQPDRALAQFDASLAIDPNHAKTLLNQGIVRAFGKQDLKGAMESWEKVIALAPDGPEGKAARQALDSLKSAHLGVTANPPSSDGKE